MIFKIKDMLNNMKIDRSGIVIRDINKNILSRGIE